VLALVVASRFGLLLGLALWLGLSTALVLLLPAVERQLPPEQAAPLGRALFRRGDLALMGAAALVLLGLGARVMIDQAAPPTSIGLPVAAMTLVRVVSLILLVLRRPAAPAVRSLLLTLEVCLSLYSLYAVS
jgi:hypothetical protein